MEINFLNLSDLHFSKKNMRDINIVLEALFKDLREMETEFDFILFNGDLINDGSQGFTGDNEFSLVETHFIKPLLEATSLNKDRIFFVPGNHDINRKNISPFLDKDLTDRFDSRDTLNQFIDDLENENNKILFKRLEGYNLFVSSFYDEKNKNEISRNDLFSTYIVKKGDYSIGIACLNSSWGAYGGEGDIGKLLIGERQIDLAARDLEDCNLRIAMFHHPLEWLREFDRESIQERLLANFDFVLNGHLHVQNYNQIIHNTFKTIFYRCGSLFQGRSFNGYAAIKYDITTREVDMYLRQYFDRRREFDKALEVVKDGHATYSLKSDVKLEVLRKNLEIKKKIKNDVRATINRKLISTIAPDTNAPKNINEIYVPPFLSRQPESYGKSKEVEFVDLDSLLYSNANIIFVGKKEIGKTTLLNYICEYFMNNVSTKVKMPIFIDYNNLPNGKNIIEKAIGNYLYEFDITDLNLSENLRHGDYILLIDNFNFDESKVIGKLNEFSEKYPNVRIIFSMNEELANKINIAEKPKLQIDYDVYYIYSYRRSQIRKLIKKWFWQQEEINQDVILDKVMTTQKVVGLPRTPLTISLLLSIFEKQSNYVPINEANLVDRFVKSLLEMPIYDEVKYESLDYTIKSEYLSYIASIMVTKQQYFLSKSEFDEETLKYFKDKGLEIKFAKFTAHFFSKGILIEQSGQISFRLQCFFELFVAKFMFMEENIAFRNELLNETEYLKYRNEITYLTGLSRKNLDIMQLIEKRLSEHFYYIDKHIDINEIINLPINEILSLSLNGTTDLQKKLSDLKLTDEEKDDILDARKSQDMETEKSDGNKIELKKSTVIFMDVLNLYANVIKNCELINKQDKKEALKICINKYCKVTVLFYKIVFDKLTSSLDEKNELNPEDRKEFEYLLTTGMPIVMQSVILQELGSPKLNTVLSECIEEAESDFEKFMMISLYSDLRLDDYVKKYEKFLKENESKVLKETSLLKLLFYRFFFVKSQQEDDKLNNLIAEIALEKSKGSRRAKANIIQDLNKRSLLNQRNEDII